MKRQKITRRDFLSGAATTAAFTIVPRHVLGGPGRVSPSEKLNIACIGVGSQGSSNAEYLTRSNNVIALCDVDEAWHKKHIQKRTSLHGIKLWTDYRVMFDKIGKDIDAVLVATPEHNHYTISTYAIRRGKHVYCQKPLCHTVNEVRMLAEEAKKQDNIESITEKAIPQLTSSSTPQDMDNDWIMNFFDKCRVVSDDDMQLLWARILSNEANSPGTYSKRTVNSLGSLDKSDAQLFIKLCGFVFILDKEPFPSLNDLFSIIV